MNCRMKTQWTFILSICFFQCIGQNSVLPLIIDIKIEKEYELTESRRWHESIIQDNGYVVNSDSVKQKYFDIALEIKNKSDRAIALWLMTCSYNRNFIINNNYIFIRGHECDSNVPAIVRLKSGESKRYPLTLKKSIKFDYPCEYCVYGRQVETTKVGLIVLDDLYEPKLNVATYDLAMEDRSKWTIVWSNSLDLLGKQPEPAFLPLKKKN
jgi:hypothetical protein